MNIIRSVFACSLTGILCVIAMNGFGQDTPDTTKLWKKGGNFTLTFSQTSLTNWAAGGENSLASNALMNLFGNYKKNKSAWDNTLQMAYGIIKQDAIELVKSEDKIDFSSKYGYQASKWWYYSALLNFKSQFTHTYKYVNDSKETVSNFLAPGYILYGVGMDYKPSDVLSLYLSPITGKTTIVMDQDMADAGAYGVDPAEYNAADTTKIKDGKNIKNELGAYLKIFFVKKILENTDLQSKIELFSSYTNHPENIDINWEVLLTMKINKFLTTNISTQLLYDDDIDIKDNEGNVLGPRTQFKEVFGVGVSFHF